MDLPLILNSATTLISLAVLILVLFRRNVELAMCLKHDVELSDLLRDVRQLQEKRRGSEQDRADLREKVHAMEITKRHYPRNGDSPT